MVWRLSTSRRSVGGEGLGIPSPYWMPCGRACRRFWQWYVLCWFYNSRCVPFSCRQALDAWHHGRCEPEGQLRGNYIVDSGSGMYFSGYSGVMLSSRCVPFCCLQAQDARHHVRYVSEGPFRGHRRLLQWHVLGWFCWLVTLALYALLLSPGTDARHHGRHGPEGLSRGVLLFSSLFPAEACARLELLVLRPSLCSYL